MEARPYPYELWPRVAREEAALLRRLARRLPLAAPEGAAAALRELLGTEPWADPMPLGVVAPGRLAESVSDPLVAIVLTPPEGAGAGAVALELDPRLAACAVDRALGGEGGREVAEPAGPLSDVERGVLAFVAARAIGQSAGRPWRVAAVVTSPAALGQAIGDGGAVVWAAEVGLGEDRGVVRAWVPETVLGAGRDDVAGRATHLRGLPLTVVLEAARGMLSGGELSALRAGDVVVLDESWLEMQGAGFGGRVRARLEGAARTTWRCRIEDGRVVVEMAETGHDAPSTRGRRMNRDDEHDTDRAVELAGDAPVEVTVEIARFTMPLEEIAALRPGEVVATGRPIGERVILRAGGRAVAEGELVDVEGEVGVRLLAIGG